MVNYCCVQNCNRNSRTSKNLNFYSIPKERQRQVLWLKTAGREDLLTKSTAGVSSYRFCSRHFPPSCMKNRILSIDAAPTLHIPGSQSEGDSDEDPLTHTDVVCDNCESPIVGFRYKCVNCKDYDLCAHCERLQVHSQHFVLRIPRPVKFKLIDNLVKKWQQLFKSEHVSPSALEEGLGSDTEQSDSSDDEPITKYSKNYDSGVDLSEDMKENIRKVIQKVVKQKAENDRIKSIAAKKKEEQQRQEKMAKQRKMKEEKKRQAEQKLKETSTKRMKLEKNSEDLNLLNVAPEVAFADVNVDVNHIKDANTPTIELKPDYSSMMPIIASVSSAGLRPTEPMISNAPMPIPPSVTSSLDSSSLATGPMPISSVSVMTVLGTSMPTSMNSTITCQSSLNISAGTAVPGSSILASLPEIPLETVNPENQQPVMHVKLSDDLTELMIEVTSNNQKTVYSYDNKQ